MEPFITAKQVISSGLFPNLTEEKLRHYVRQGKIRAHGHLKSKTFLLSEVYRDWKNKDRRIGLSPKSPINPTIIKGKPKKAWRKV